MARALNCGSRRHPAAKRFCDTSGAAPCEKCDFPNLRRSLQCAACDGVKLKGCVVCWACYGRLGMRFGNPVAERMLARAEQCLVEAKS
jgi:hypothetical protein